MFGINLTAGVGYRAAAAAVAGPATHFSVTGPSTSTAGDVLSFTVIARDADELVATGYTGEVHFTSSDVIATLPANDTLTDGVGIFSVTLKTAGSKTVTATDTVTASINGTSGAVTVSAAAVASLSTTGAASSTAGDNYTVTVTALDTYGNTATGYTGTVHFTSTDGNVTLPANGTLSSGTRTFTGVVLKTAGTQTITANDVTTPAIADATSNITVVHGAAASFTVTGANSVTAGEVYSATVTAKDAFNNTATGYGGTVTITSNATGPTLPSDSVLTSGVKVFSVTFNVAETGRTVTATDTVTAGITGTKTGIDVEEAEDVWTFEFHDLSSSSPGILEDALFGLRILKNGVLDPDWTGEVLMEQVDSPPDGNFKYWDGDSYEDIPGGGTNAAIYEYVEGDDGDQDFAALFTSGGNVTLRFTADGVTTLTLPNVMDVGA